MYPQIEYDEINGIAYIAFSTKPIVKTIASEDDLLVFDIDRDGELVGVEILSVNRLRQKFDRLETNVKKITPEMIPAFLIPEIYQSRKVG